MDGPIRQNELPNDEDAEVSYFIEEPIYDPFGEIPSYSEDP